MRAIVQRVSQSEVSVNGVVIGHCGVGLLLLVGVRRGDTAAQAAKLADKIAGLRIFDDAAGKMNLALADLPIAEEPNILAISNFTVYGETAKNRRPSFMESAGFEAAKTLFDGFVTELRTRGLNVETGEFGAHMKVSLTNDGPVTLIVDV